MSCIHYEDVHLIDIEPYFHSASEKFSLQTSSTQTQECLDNSPPVKSLPTIAQHSRQVEVFGLPQIVASGVKRKIAAYESLQLAGFIKGATEYLLEDISG